MWDIRRIEQSVLRRPVAKATVRPSFTPRSRRKLTIRGIGHRNMTRSHAIVTAEIVFAGRSQQQQNRSNFESFLDWKPTYIIDWSVWQAMAWNLWVEYLGKLGRETSALHLCIACWLHTRGERRSIAYPPEYRRRDSTERRQSALLLRILQ
jgi:hypothetical protein